VRPEGLGKLKEFIHLIGSRTRNHRLVLQLYFRHTSALKIIRTRSVRLSSTPVTLFPLQKFIQPSRANYLYAIKMNRRDVSSNAKVYVASSVETYPLDQNVLNGGMSYTRAC
jgi:hypothetical protein